MINPRIFYSSEKISAPASISAAVTISAAASISANATANANAATSLPDFPDISKPYPDNSEDFGDDED